MTKERQELLKLMGELSDKYPDWRLGQLVLNAATFADAECWDAEDNQLIQAIKQHLAKQAKVNAA
jgi:hypothetical protein